MEFKLFDSIGEMKKVLVNKKPRLVKAGTKNICIVRQDENLIAFENECPHMGEALNNGPINHLDEIVCPLHSYRFNIQTGESVERQCRSLKKIKVISEIGVYLVF
ncbi:MAG: Rieske (2Fe-2S) protein [Ekhidna sp.]